MNIHITIISLFTLLFYSGCAQFNVDTTKQKQKQKEEISTPKPKKQTLNEHDKLIIYRTIQNKVKKYNEKGDEAYKAGYNSDAIIAYELVNYYKDYSAISTEKINKIKKTAKTKSQYHYKQGLKQSKKDKKLALIEFNIVMMNNPSYKDTKKKFKSLKKNKDIKKLINSLESKLKMKLSNNKGTSTDLEVIRVSLQELVKYDYKNKTVFKAKKILKENRKKIAKIEIKKKKELSLKLSQKALEKKEYKKSIVCAQEVLEIDSNNEEAKKIIDLATKESKGEILNLIKKGKIYYEKKELNKAMESFQKVLKMDPLDETSLIYSKKIQRQLKTIKSLE